MKNTINKENVFNLIAQCPEKYSSISYVVFPWRQGSPAESEGKEFACSAGSIPGWGRSPGEGKGNPLQYSCLENSMDQGDWWATVHGVGKSPTRLSDFHFHQRHRCSFYTHYQTPCALKYRY